MVVEIVADHSTKLGGVPVHIKDAQIAKCNHCGGTSVHAKELERWEALMILTQDEANKYGDPALRQNRPIIWMNDVPHIIRGVQQATPEIGNILVLAVKGRHGSRILISRPDSINVSGKLRAGETSIDLGNMRDA